MAEMRSLNLSKASKLKRLEFPLAKPGVQWITTTLRTIDSKNLQYICINSNNNIPRRISEAVRQEWQDLDHLLVQFWTSHSIRPRLVYVAGKGEKNLRDKLPALLPELTRRGLVDLFEAAD